MSDQTDVPVGMQEQLFEELRRIKQASGFSYGQLADKTHYSRSSWERFLNGKQLPSKVAVEQFAAATGADPHPLLALLIPAAQTQPQSQYQPQSQSQPSGQEQEPATTADEADEPQSPEPALVAPKTPEPAPRAVKPARLGPHLPEWVPPLLARRRADGRPSWRRRLGAVGYIASGAVMGTVTTVLVMGAGVGQPGGSGSTPGAQASSTGPGKTAPVPAAGKVAVRCSGDTCHRRDPQAMDCQWDATTAHDTWLRGMHIELRYSPSCHAVWGRIEAGAVGDVVTIKDRTGLEQEATILTDRDTYTQMLAVTDEAPPNTVTICGAIPSQKQQECSPSAKVQP